MALPRIMPSDLRLTGLHEMDGDGRAWMMTFEYGDDGSLHIQYGTGTFDGCGSDMARPTRVSDQPAMILPSSGWTELVWSATPSDPVGRFGLGGTLSSRDLRAMAQTMPIAETVPASGC